MDPHEPLGFLTHSSPICPFVVKEGCRIYERVAGVSRSIVLI